MELEPQTSQIGDGHTTIVPLALAGIGKPHVRPKLKTPQSLPSLTVSQLLTNKIYFSV
jgi:hypothetical protein